MYNITNISNNVKLLQCIASVLNKILLLPLPLRYCVIINYFDILLSFGFLPAITLSTRLSNTNSLIDNIFVSKQGNMNCVAILENKISDHQVIAINTNLSIPKLKIRYITIYPNREECKKNFKMILPRKEYMTN